ncbi:metal ABC transporter substrate-binding protein [Leucobacter tenebrionis]|uniref:metal ABC transporter substrate-binding protein n=1 Tax=Leucobacter tenebrionis TaxID=2873270 RepID=UPI001CA777B0|nr:metal ABC transporter substrate-binding protein [Leucobacter tenebrionis]QZY50763.1 metal ABC transporter substrate-binding protein [Leucobacter tenebrionis]
MSRTSSSRHPLRLAALGGAALAAVLALTSCGAGGAGSGDASDELKVVATTTQLTDFAAQVGGDDIQLTGLLAPGGSAHHFDPSPADLLALGEADVLIVNGVGLETFVDSAIEASGFDGEIITAANGLDPEMLREVTAEGGGAEEHDHAHEGEAADHADAEHAHDEHAHEAEAEAHDEHAEEEHDHDHGDVNPHIWTSPSNAEGMVSMIAGDLARIDPDHADDYTERADAYVAQLQDLDAWVAAQFENVPAEQRVLVSGHDSLRYYLHDYGIAFAGSILPSFEDNAEPSAAEMDALVASIKERGVKAVFVESSMSPKLAQTIAKEAGVEVVDAEALYADSLGAPDAAEGAVDDGISPDTYIGATVHNTRVILEAWGVEPEPLPASLQE